MHSLTISFGPTGVFWQFLFKDKTRSEAAAVQAHANHGITIVDDFGMSSYFMAGSIVGVLLEDLDLVEEARIQRTLADARGQAKLQIRAKGDAILREAMSAQRTPVLTPMGPNGFGRG